MRALVLDEPWSLSVQERPDPVAGPGEVLIDIIATGICGSDFHGFSGENGRRHPGQVMGHETVGRIAALGEGVAGFAVGDVVTVNPVMGCTECEQCRADQAQTCATKRVIGVDPSYSSAFAERMVVPQRCVVPLPAGVPIEFGALVEPLAVGYHALDRARCREGDTVLVIGGGPIGQACVLAARRLGATAVAVSEPSASRRELNEKLGAVGVDPSAGDLGQQVRAALGTLPSIVVDAVGISATMQSAFECAPLGSTIVLVGMGAPELTLAAYEISTKERTVVGSFCYTDADFRSTTEWLAASEVDLSVLIQDTVGMDGAQQAFTDLAKGTSSASKILVRLDS